jgi:hypothetical protein
MATILPLAGVLLAHSAVATGFLAAAIAVGGFIARARAILRAASETELQHSTTMGGICGLSFALILIVIDVIVS